MEDGIYDSYSQLDAAIATPERRYPFIPIHYLLDDREITPGTWFVHFNLAYPKGLHTWNLKGTALSAPNEDGNFRAILDTGKRVRLNLEGLGIAERSTYFEHDIHRIPIFSIHAAHILAVDQIVLNETRFFNS